MKNSEQLCKEYMTAYKNGKDEEYLNTLDIMQLVILRYNLGLVRTGKDFYKEYTDVDKHNNRIINNQVSAKIGR